MGFPQLLRNLAMMFLETREVTINEAHDDASSSKIKINKVHDDRPKNMYAIGFFALFRSYLWKICFE